MAMIHWCVKESGNRIMERRGQAMQPNAIAREDQIADAIGKWERAMDELEKFGGRELPDA